MNGLIRWPWVMRAPLANDNPDVVAVTKQRLEAEMARSIETRQFRVSESESLDFLVVKSRPNTLRPPTFPFVLVAEQFIFVTRRQVKEIRLEKAMESRVDVDDEIIYAEETMLDVDDDELTDLLETLIYRRADLDREITELRKDLGWY